MVGINRREFLKGSLAVGVAAGIGAAGSTYWFDPGWAFADGPTVGLGTGTAPEQVHLTWGQKPAHDVTVSWAAPGSTPQPAPSVTVGTRPVTALHPGTPAAVESVAFSDGMNLETVQWYHAPLTGLAPDTTYFYRISDGSNPANTFSGQFTTAPAGDRVAFRFTSFGDLATPTAHLNQSGHSWQESSDNSYYAVGAVESAAPLFHLLNGDLCYANLNTNNQPEVWRDFLNNVTRSAANRPWMPTLGNHEIEFGVTAQDGTGSGIWNGPYGYGSYQTRFRLPDNGVPRYRGNFYSFQVGTVVFVCLDADDVIYQDGGSFYTPGNTTTAPLTATNPAVAIPPGSSTYNREYTGALTAGSDNDLVPDPSAAQPNHQTLWLERTLRDARRRGDVDLIVVVMHQCALSSSMTGNGSDLGVRQAWLPLFDRYGVDLVLSGHEHNYERSSRYAATSPATWARSWGPTRGSRRQVPRSSPVARGGRRCAEDGRQIRRSTQSEGTVFLVLGGGGTDGPTNVYGVDSTNGSPKAKVITTGNLIHEVNASGQAVPTGDATAVGWTKDGADSVEDAPWSARRDVAMLTGSPSSMWTLVTAPVTPRSP